MHTLEQAMKSIVPGELHLVVIERQDQATGILWTRHPQQRLANLSSSGHLGRVEVRASAHSVVVLDSLTRRLGTQILARGEGCIWTSADFEDVIKALDEYDLACGRLVARDGIKVHDPVYVTNMGRGVVTGFTRCGRLMVKLDRADGLADVGAFAPRSCVKPVLRAVHP